MARMTRARSSNIALARHRERTGCVALGWTWHASRSRRLLSPAAHALASGPAHVHCAACCVLCVRVDSAARVCVQFAGGMVAMVQEVEIGLPAALKGLQAVVCDSK
jgi:hypothetical protein